jgi:hypothetical protein
MIPMSLSMRADEVRSMQAVFRRLSMAPRNARNGHRQITLAEVTKQPDCSNATCHGCR